MPSKWDEEEKRTDKEQSEFYPDLAPKVKMKPAESVWRPGPGDLHYPSMWQRWGFPAGLTLGIIIGLFLGYLSVWLIILLFRVIP